VEHRATDLRELETRVLTLRRQMGEVAGHVAKADATLAAKRRAEDAAQRTAAGAERNAAAARDAVLNAETMLADLKFENAAYVLRTRLSAGVPCPVCEQRVTEAPALHPEHSLAEAEAAVASARERVRTAQEAVQRATQTLARAQTELGSVETAKAEAEASLERLNEEMAALLPPEFAGCADRIAALRKDADAAVVTAERRVVDARAVVTRAQTAFARVEGERRGLPALASRRKAHATLQARCAAAAEQVKRVCGKPPGDEAAAELAAIAARLAEAATAKTAATSAVPRAAAAVHELELTCQRLAQRVATEEQAARAATEERERLTHECRQVEAALKAVRIALRGDVLGTIRAEIGRLADAKLARDRLLAKRAELVTDHARAQEDVATLRGRRVERAQQRDAVAAEVQAAHEEVQRVRAHLAAAVAASGWPGWDEVDAAGTEEVWLAAIASETQTVHEHAVAEQMRLSTEARTLAGRLRRATECRARHAEAQREANVAGELGQLLMANRFRSYLLEEAIRTLAADGSRHLQELSGGRYAFHTEGAEFQIVDGWNADERRSVKTLSGGETFLASLALALGLAEGLPALGPGEHGHQRLESLFIDEGFGTLDPDETLDIVTQALENLRTGDRIVGIVTHLPQLAERLPAQIRVVKSQVGSHIEITSE
ncbi:MAG: SbcC/MukB-like Walker B domain-containing protein, partial [Gammaproteobacteria bacterium]